MAVAFPGSLCHGLSRPAFKKKNDITRCIWLPSPNVVSLRLAHVFWLQVCSVVWLSVMDVYHNLSRHSTAHGHLGHLPAQGYRETDAGGFWHWGSGLLTYMSTWWSRLAFPVLQFCPSRPCAARCRSRLTEANSSPPVKTDSCFHKKKKKRVCRKDQPLRTGACIVRIILETRTAALGEFGSEIEKSNLSYWNRTQPDNTPTRTRACPGK